MKSKFFMITLLILQSFFVKPAAAEQQTRFVQPVGQNMIQRPGMQSSPAPYQATPHMAAAITQLAAMQRAYHQKINNVDKAEFINSILHNEKAELSTQIQSIKILQKVVNNDIRSHKGWLWNEDQEKINWLYQQQEKISARLAELEWKQYPVLETIYPYAKYASFYLAFCLAAYLSQEKISETFGTNYNYSYGEITWMPLEQILLLAKQLTILGKDVAITGGTLGKQAAGIGYAIGSTGASGIVEAGSTIAKNSLIFAHNESLNAANFFEQSRHAQTSDNQELQTPPDEIEDLEEDDDDQDDEDDEK